jgi:hypothetical protein
MFKVYPKDSLLIRKANNGYIATIKGTREMQEDGLDGEYVFSNLDTLCTWLRLHFKGES